MTRHIKRRPPGALATTSATPTATRTATVATGAPGQVQTQPSWAPSRYGDGNTRYAEPYEEKQPRRDPAPAGPQRPRGAAKRRANTNTVTVVQLDPFAAIIGGLIGLLVLGLTFVVFAAGSGTGGVVYSPAANAYGQRSLAGSGSGAGSGGSQVSPTAGTVAAISQSPSQQQQQSQPTSSEIEPTRIPLAEFKALYDDPAKRPLLVDARAKDKFDEGHIKGAVSIPLADLAGRVAEVPKDRLVVAYCQWPAENESASWARELINQYGYSPDRVKVLQGGWGTWKENNAKDPKAYPIEIASQLAPSPVPGTTPAATGSGSNQPAVVIVTPAPAETPAP